MAPQSGSPIGSKEEYADWAPFVFLHRLRGQYVLANPETKLVLVQASLSSDNFLDLELAALWSAAPAQLP
jgi:hypothetical protein